MHNTGGVSDRRRHDALSMIKILTIYWKRIKSDNKTTTNMLIIVVEKINYNAYLTLWTKPMVTMHNILIGQKYSYISLIHTS